MHMGVGLAVKPLAPGVNVGWLILGNYVLDFLWFGFAAVGLEVWPKPGVADHPPWWEHSLLMAVVWSVLFGLLASWLGRRSRQRTHVGVVFGLMVFAHWVVRICSTALTLRRARQIAIGASTSRTTARRKETPTTGEVSTADSDCIASPAQLSLSAITRIGFPLINPISAQNLDHVGVFMLTEAGQANFDVLVPAGCPAWSRKWSMGRSDGRKAVAIRCLGRVSSKKIGPAKMAGPTCSRRLLAAHYAVIKDSRARRFGITSVAPFC